MRKMTAFLFATVFSICLLTGCKTVSSASKSQTAQNNDSLKILTIGTADSGGTMYPVGQSIASLLGGTDPSIKINISASTGSTENVRSLKDGSIDLGLVSGDIAFAAVNGTGEFSDSPYENLRVVAALYPSLSNWIASDDSGLFYVHDLKGKRLGLGPQDSTSELAAKAALSAMGIRLENVSYVNCSLGGGAEQIKDQTLDAVHGFTGIPIPGFLSLANAIPCHLLRYTDSELCSIIRSNSFYYIEEIPKDTYPGQKTSVKTFGIKCLLCVSADMDEDLVYEITSVLYENRSRLKDLHSSLSYADQDGFLYENLPIELHSGAKKYYEEHNLLSGHNH